MDEFHVTTTPVAKKNYLCDAAEWLLNTDMDDFTEAEQKIMFKAREENFMILKGTRYVKITGRTSEGFYTFRARQDLHDICMENDVYEE